MKSTAGLAAAISLIVSGCATTADMAAGFSGPDASTWTPQIDPTGVDQAKFEDDFGECRTFAEQNPEADGKEQARAGARRMGTMGVISAAALTVASGGLAAPILAASAGTVALVGGTTAVAGAMTARSSADAKYKEIITRCLITRGYRVLG